MTGSSSRRSPGWRRLLGAIQSDFLAGILVVVPLAITVAAGIWIAAWVDGLLDLLPDFLNPEIALGLALPGLGIFLTLVVVILAGAATRYVGGRQVVAWYETVLLRVPILRVVYQGFRQLLDTVFSGQSKSFRQVVLIEYPRRNVWAIAFLTGEAQFMGPATGHGPPSDGMVSLFLPTTPNPTSGFFLMMPAADIFLVDLTVEEAFKMIISAGIVVPGALRSLTRLSEISDLPVLGDR
jgi:uncharacterized membrane protein